MISAGTNPRAAERRYMLPEMNLSKPSSPAGTSIVRPPPASLEPFSRRLVLARESNPQHTSYELVALPLS